MFSEILSLKILADAHSFVCVFFLSFFFSLDANVTLKISRTKNERKTLLTQDRLLSQHGEMTHTQPSESGSLLLMTLDKCLCFYWASVTCENEELDYVTRSSLLVLKPSDCE